MWRAVHSEMTRRSFDSPRAAEIFNRRTFALLLTLHFCDFQLSLEIAHNALVCPRVCPVVRARTCVTLTD